MKSFRLFSVVLVLITTAYADAQGIGGGIFRTATGTLKSGTADPASCTVGRDNIFYRTDLGQLRLCTASDTYTGVTTSGGTYLAADGTAAAPSYSFASAGNSGTGMFLSAADSIGFATNDIERWLINASGSFNPLLANTYSIGSSLVPVKDITLSAGGGSEIYIPSGVITVSTTSAATAADLVETDLWTFDLPASTLNSDGDAIRITVFGSAAANANTKTVKVYFGAGNATLFSDTSSATGWSGTLTVIRTGASAQFYAMVGTHGSGIASNVNGTFARDTTATIQLKVTGQNGVASAGDITFKGVIVEALP